MEPLAPTLVQWLRLLVAMAVFITPGYLVARNLPRGDRWIAAFVASCAWLFHLSLMLGVLRIPLRAGTVGAVLIATSLAIWLLLRRRPIPIPVPLHVEAPANNFPGRRLWIVPVIIAATSVIVRCVVDPLSGYDQVFRWDYLARLIRWQGNLDFYPATTAADFELYAWCDGIPPLIPLLNFWIYAVTDSFAPVLTVARTGAETLLLSALVFRFARLQWGSEAGWPALAILGASSLAAWSVANGQETAMTAISLVAMLYFLERHRREPLDRWVMWAAVAGSVGALARDYAVAFPLLGACVLAFRIRGRPLWLFAGTATLLSAPWYLRNAFITGNPLHPHTLGGLLPGNPLHEETMRAFARVWGLDSGALDGAAVLLAMLAIAGVPLLLGAIGLIRTARERLTTWLGAGLIVALWAWSLPQTAGGWAYSFRMLLPAVALFAIQSGWVSRCSARLQVLALALVSAVTVDAARRAWILPEFATAAPLPYTWTGWRESHDGLQSLATAPKWAALVHSAQGRRIVVDHPAHHAFITERGGHAVPFFSPALSESFNAERDFATTQATLQREGIRFITLTTINPFTREIVVAHAFWRELVARYEPMTIGTLAIYDLDKLQSR